MPSAFAALASAKSVQSGGQRLGLGEYLCEVTDLKLIQQRSGCAALVMDFSVVSEESPECQSKAGSNASTMQRLSAEGTNYALTMIMAVLGFGAGCSEEDEIKRDIPGLLDAKITGQKVKLPSGGVADGTELVGRKFRMSVRPGFKKEKQVAKDESGRPIIGPDNIPQTVEVKVPSPYHKELFFPE